MEHACMQTHAEAEAKGEKAEGMDPLKGLFLAQQVAPCTLPTRLLECLPSLLPYAYVITPPSNDGDREAGVREANEAGGRWLPR